MKYKISSICFLIILFSSYQSCFAYRANINILDSLSKVGCDNICRFISENGFSSSTLTISRHPAEQFLKNQIITSGKKHNIVFFTRDTVQKSTGCLFETLIRDFSVKYSNHKDDDDLLIREFNLNISSVLTDRAGSIKPFVFANNFRDTIPRARINEIQDNQNDFAHSEIPEPPKSVFREIIEPVVVISVAVLTVLLLFSVRSR